MKTIQLTSWEEWESTSLNLIEDIKEKKSQIGTTYSSLLFRGHSCESWALNTTLERYTDKQFSIEEYHCFLRTVLPAFATYTGKNWSLETNPSINDLPEPPPGYQFMVYLRHHGFPTPLLDWTRSPYIAAFFAFQNSGQEENVAVFTFIEYFGGAKGAAIGAPTICECGPYVDSHQRHFQQQVQYTICKEKISGRLVYCNHDKVFQRKDPTQDVVTKYLIPSNEKHKALSKLDLMNINAFSFYGNEEGLAEMLAYGEIMKRIL